MASNRSLTEEARSKAQEKFAKAEQRDREATIQRQKAYTAMVEKTRRLRAMRLAKEEADKQAKEEADRQAPKPKKARPAARSAPVEVD